MKFLILIVVLVLIVIYFYNRIVAMREAVISSETEISVQLDRRGKVFDSLLATVKKYLSHESEVFSKITELRTKPNRNRCTGARSGRCFIKNGDQWCD